MLTKSLLRMVTRAHSFQCSYKNVEGKIVWAQEKTMVKVLEELTKTKISTDEDLLNLLKARRHETTQKKVPSVKVFWPTSKKEIKIYLQGPPPSNLTATLKSEDHSEETIILKLKSSLQKPYGIAANYTIEANLKIGYHHLCFNVEAKEANIFLICPPERLEVKGKKSWGPFVPTYALRSNNDWGIGSFKEMKDLAKLIRPYGAKWMGLLPMLAGNFNAPNCDPSPYSSVTRLFWNEIYLDVEAVVKKYGHNPAKELIESKTFQEKIENLRSLEMVDYFQVYQAKKEVLSLVSDWFFENKKDQEAQYQHFKRENPSIEAYVQFKSSLKKEQDFHRFTQFEMYESLQSFQKETGIGLYMDYPVGVNDSGFDYKEFRNVFFGEVSVGAPPEPIFALGQDWGFPAFHPSQMQEDQYQYFRKSINQHLKFGKILRLDHIMGLYRIYSVPKKFKGDEGIYLRFPKEDLFAVVILEAHKLGVDLIGENLGTVPQDVDQIIGTRNLNGMWVLQCETWRSLKDSLHSMKESNLACINTHDMPMLETFRNGTDLNQVASLGILDNELAEKLKAERLGQVKNWEKELTFSDFLANALTSIAASPVKYFVINLEDFWKETRPQNIPGTWKEYPNWRKKFNLTVEQMKDSTDVKKFFTILKNQRGNE